MKAGIIHTTIGKDASLVAIVDVTGYETNEALEYAFQITQNEDVPWIKNGKVSVIVGDNQVRSTSVGDAIIIGDDVYSVGISGFKKIS